MNAVDAKLFKISDFFSHTKKRTGEFINVYFVNNNVFPPILFLHFPLSSLRVKKSNLDCRASLAMTEKTNYPSISLRFYKIQNISVPCRIRVLANYGDRTNPIVLIYQVPSLSVRPNPIQQLIRYQDNASVHTL